MLQARYRWLRAQHWCSDGKLLVVRPHDLPVGMQTYAGQLLDHGIDAAMSTTRPEAGR